MYSAYLNGIEISVGHKMNAESFRKCEVPRIPVLNLIGNKEDQKKSVLELPMVGFSTDCGSFAQNHLVRYIKITRNAEEAASRHWAMCHVGIYASERRIEENS